MLQSRCGDQSISRITVKLLKAGSPNAYLARDGDFNKPLFQEIVPPYTQVHFKPDPAFSNEHTDFPKTDCRNCRHT